MKNSSVKLTLHKAAPVKVLEKVFQLSTGSTELAALYIMVWDSTCCLHVTGEGQLEVALEPLHGDKVEIEFRLFATGFEVWSHTKLYTHVFSKQLDFTHLQFDNFSSPNATSVIEDVRPLLDSNGPTLLLPSGDNRWDFVDPISLQKYNMLDATTWENSRVQTFHSEKLAQILYYASQHVAFYRSLYAHDQFEQLPILTRHEYVNARDLFMSNEYTRFESWRLTTSGSTGTPFSFYTNSHDFSQLGMMFFQLFINEICGIGIYGNEKVLGFRLDSGNTRYIRFPTGFSYNCMHDRQANDDTRWVSLPVMSYCGQEEALYQLALFNLSQPNFKAIVGPPSVLTDFVDYCDSIGTDLHLGKMYITSGEQVYAETRQFFSKRGLVLRDYFHSPDGSSIFYECENGIYHAHPLKFYPETATFEGEQYLVSTALYNTSMSFIRYLNGDVISGLEWERCTCGRSGPLVKSIQGRQGDRLVSKNRKFVSPNVLYSLLSSKEDLGRWRLVQENHTSTILYVENPKSKQVEEVLRSLSDYFNPHELSVKQYGEFPTPKKNRPIIRLNTHCHLSKDS